MTLMRLVLLLLVTAFGLTGCRTFWDPTFMPAGYTYHQEVYKAPPGPEADDIGYAYTPERNEEVIHIWRIVAQDIVAQLEEQSGIAGGAVYVAPHENPTAFTSSFDHVLREQLHERGYTLVPTPEGAAYLRYDAVPAPQDQDTMQNPEGFEDYEVTLQIVDLSGKEEIVIAQSGGIYKLPSYGYRGGMPHLLKPITGGAL
jgi:hypothetical protein